MNKIIKKKTKSNTNETNQNKEIKTMTNPKNIKSQKGTFFIPKFNITFIKIKLRSK
ncbi:hypothetical protein [Candidatus Phytoplasma solani]|uniref:Uncharacterized protein n=1 Tax=Candidatus Phytoplasma solani TaxID=69896 RepID=A0A421NUB0_9MOLU|nr:hypothetical protein [Candidatus Phytoplasma solani]RMI87595.1 hypothetical protein PSSA1_v1c6840 [Candidatus Phytoplasma solani]